MNLRSSRTLTFFVIAAIFVSGLSPVLAFDEGMFPPDQIAKLPLAKRGLKIKPTDIYNPTGGGLSEAIVRLSIGCTGEFVSPDGLILTNHHCAFDGLSSASSPGKDLVEDGFNAGSRKGEIPAKDYSIMLTHRIENVTNKIRLGTANLTGDALAAGLKANLDKLQAAEQAEHPGSTIVIQALNNGYHYYLYQTSEIKDIRLVYAPPRNIGVFGGDPDNFEWTRHTGDFAFLRAYVGPDGKPAAYSPNNIPFKPRKFLTISLNGLKENDFVFVMGFPGGTTRYRESWSIKYARDANFPFLYRWLRALSGNLRAIGQNDEEKRIAFQSDIANFDNSRKLYEGGTQRLKLAQVVQAREAEEAKMSAWTDATPDRQKRYGTVLSELKTLSETTNAAQNRDVIFRRFPDPNSMPVLGAVVAAITAVKQGKKLTDAEKKTTEAAIKKAFAEREPEFEREMIKFFLKEMDALPANQRFEGADKRFAGKTAAERRANEAAFANMVATGELSKPENVMKLYGESWDELKKDHPFATAVVDERLALAARTANFAAKIDPLRLAYQQALAEMRSNTPYPDANFTMRFTYGNIKGYKPREGETRTAFSTVKGIIEKNTGEIPFDAPQKLIDLQRAKDFGRYGEGDSVVVNFISSTDIIGGNSGSPIMNGNGELVGVVFDGNYEGLGNDFYYDKDVNRSISVDIRYVLFVTEKFSGAKWVVDELKTVGGPAKTRAARAGAAVSKLETQDDRVVRNAVRIP